MRALVYVAPGCLEIQEAPVPEPRPGQALVRVECTGICGSDMAGYEGRSSRRVPPLILGHEVVGSVVSAPDGGPVRAGDRVVANPLQACRQCEACRSGRENRCESWRLLGMDHEQGGFAEYVAVDAANLWPLPTGVTARAAVMVEPLANAVHVMGLAEAGRFQTMAIFGGGTQGALALMLARLLGHRDVAVVETCPERRALSGELGAALCLDPARDNVAAALRAWTGSGVDVAIEAVGIEPTRQSAVACVRKGGRVVMLGLHDQSSVLDLALIVRSEIEIVGSFAYTPADFARSLKLIGSGELDPSPWVELISLDAGSEAFERMRRGPGRTLKIALAP
jgi:2-desacetyl-2-hydroxyethyl bacteriochlorophyllide A dehydrogenase